MRNSLFTKLIFLTVLTNIYFITNGYASTYMQLDNQQLNQYELIASKARNYYWQGRYDDAINLYKTLTETKHASNPLYLKELASSYVALGLNKEAKFTFLDSVQFFQDFNTAEIEKEAISSFGKEASKIYIGDPYERALTYFFLAVIFINEGDYDNALASCKNALLADSDAKDNKFESDFTLIELLTAKIYLLRNEPDKAEEYFNLAKKSYLLTHPETRKLVAEQQELIEIFNMPEKEREKLDQKYNMSTLKYNIEHLENEINTKTNEIDVNSYLGNVITGEYNLLILVPDGKGPRKRIEGTDGNLIVFELENSDSQLPEIEINSEKLYSPITNIADINFQATTQGGRHMDAILNGKAVNRRTTVGAGKLLTEVGNNLGGSAGLAIVLAGAVVQGVGGSMTPEADTRSWQTLPQEYKIFALNLSKGTHQLSFYQYKYFELLNEIKHEVVIDDNNIGKLTIFLAPPTPTNVYSQQAYRIKSKNDIEEKNSANNLVLISPPLGLQDMEKYYSKSVEGKAEFFSPNIKKILKKTTKKLEKAGLNPIIADHETILADRNKYNDIAQIAFQLELVDSLYEIIDKNEKYITEFRFSFIDVKSGKTLLAENISEESLKVKNSELTTTDIFYESLEKATNTFLSQANFSELFNRSKSSITLLEN